MKGAKIMKTSTLSKFLTMLVLGGLILGASLPGSASQPVTPIPPGPFTSLPDYIGAPAKAHPLANTGVPQNPSFAPNGLAHGHSDSWMSDAADLAGPLGRNLVISSTDLAGIHQNSWVMLATNISIDSHGRLVVYAHGVEEASINLLDPDTLEILAHYPLAVQPGEPQGEGEQKFQLSAWSIYGYLDNHDRVHVISEGKVLLTLAIVDTASGPEIELEGEPYDLTDLVMDEDGKQVDRIAGVFADFQGRYWLNMGASANIYVLDPATAQGPYTKENLPHVNLGPGEFTRNGHVLAKEGGYIVTTQAMYRVDIGADGWPYVVWRQAYDTIGAVRPGQYELGSGTTPTLLGEGKYVAITDNAPQMNLVVYRTEPDEKLGAGQQRIVCKIPVFDFPGGGAGADSNSVIGFHNSIIVQNSTDYLFDWGSGRLARPGKPGLQRIDINPNGKGCTKVWVNTEVRTIACPRLSTRTGLIYTMDRKLDPDNNVYAVYWVALDFRTGKVAWEKLAGTFRADAPATFDNFWSPTTIAPNGALYLGGYAGLMAVRDGP